MIGPRMATMLALITTDAALTPDTAQRSLTGAVDNSFNCISKAIPSNLTPRASANRCAEIARFSWIYPWETVQAVYDSGRAILQRITSDLIPISTPSALSKLKSGVSILLAIRFASAIASWKLTPRKTIASWKLTPRKTPTRTFSFDKALVAEVTVGDGLGVAVRLDEGLGLSVRLGKGLSVNETLGDGLGDGRGSLSSWILTLPSALLPESSEK